MKTNINRIVVVGGFGLIGQAIVKKIRLLGLSPIIIDIKKEESLLEEGDLFYEADLFQKESEELLYHHLKPIESEIAGWVNVAYPRTADFGKYNFLDDIHDDGLANLTLHGGTFYRSCRLAIKLLENKGGSIVNFGSIYGPLGPDMRIYNDTVMKNPAAYSMIKEAIVGLTRYIATCFANKNIRCNALCPGGVYDKQNEIFVRKYSERVPMGRMATAEEVASATVFLLSTDSSYITGQVLMVDGGLSAW